MKTININGTEQMIKSREYKIEALKSFGLNVDELVCKTDTEITIMYMEAKMSYDDLMKAYNDSIEVYDDLMKEFTDVSERLRELEEKK